MSNHVLPEIEIREMCYYLVGIIQNIFVSDCNIRDTLDSGINVGVRLLVFEKKLGNFFLKNDRNALFDVKMN